MKVRKLRELLNDTGYTVAQTKDKVVIGTSLCHDLLSVEKATLSDNPVVKYALDYDRKGAIKTLESKYNGKGELLFLAKKLQELLESDDDTSSMIEIYSCEDGVLVTKYTEKCEYPNVTHDGYIIYNNEWFTSKKDALSEGISYCSSATKSLEEVIDDRERELEKIRERLAMQKHHHRQYTELLNVIQE